MEKKGLSLTDGGYDLSRLKGTLKYQEITCNSCKKIIKNGEICSKCFKAFCGSCLSKLVENHSSCPKGGDHAKMPLLPLYETFLNELMIACVNAKYGCSEVKEYKLIQSHEDECEFVPVKCNYSGCDVVLPKKEIAEHLGVCGFCPLTCKDCGENILRKDVERHDKMCLEKIVPCENTGCKDTIKRKNMKAHREKCLYELIECKWCKNKKMRESIVNHEIECDCKIVVCSGCKKGYENRVYKEHVKNCEEFEFACEKCSMIIKRKEATTHNCLSHLAKKIISLEEKVIAQSIYIEKLEAVIEKIACKNVLENRTKCEKCKIDLCISCGNNKCYSCNSVICKEKCSLKCSGCNGIVCKEKCLGKCSGCNGILCKEKCLGKCFGCNGILCKEKCLGKCSGCNGIVCKEKCLGKCKKCGLIICEKICYQKCNTCKANCCILCTVKCNSCGEIQCKDLHAFNCEKCKKNYCKKHACLICKANVCEFCHKVDNFEFDSNKATDLKDTSFTESNRKVYFSDCGVICGNIEFKSGLHIYQVICHGSGCTCGNFAGFGIAESNDYNTNFKSKGCYMSNSMIGIFTKAQRGLSGKFTEIKFGSIYEVKVDFNALAIEITGPDTELKGALKSGISYLPCFTSCTGTIFSIPKVLP